MAASQPGDPPRRGSFQEAMSLSPLARASTSASEVLTDGRMSFSAGAASMNETSILKNQQIDLDEDAMLTDDNIGFTKSASASRRPSMTPQTTSAPPPRQYTSPSSDGSMIEVKPGQYQLPVDASSRPSGKLKNRYVLANGAVVNGKGLGRGRPGFKRGPRKSALSSEVVDESASGSATISTPSPAPQGRSTSSAKRKRAASDLSVKAENQDDDDQSSWESTPEYNPSAATQTRSGRQSQKPIPIIPTPSTIASPAAKRPVLIQTTSSPTVKKHPKIKAKVYRGREQFALCEHCLRSNGPPGNLIVFCDACNKCWHQRCHEPRISKEVVADTKAEWFCSDCDRILHGKKKNKPGPKPAAQQPQNIMPAPQAITPKPEPPQIKYGVPLVPGMNLTPDQRRQYLNACSKEKLMSIILMAADMAPNMPIFETPYQLVRQPSIPISQPTQPAASPIPQMLAPATPSQPPKALMAIAGPSNVPIYSHPTAGVPSKPNTQPPPVNGAEDDEGYYDDFDEMALLYPKPGQGVYDLSLPPESTELGLLLEGPGCRTFSHWVRGMGEMKTTV